MADKKYIYWRPDMAKDAQGQTFANVHLLVGYNQGSIRDFQEMAAELRETFPQATDKEICCSKICHSERVNKFTIITWNAHITADEYPGWEQLEGGNIEYSW